jgi:hypothetical protein
MVYVSSLPAANPRFVFTFRMTPDSKLKQKDNVTFKIAVINPSGKEFFNAQGNASLAEKLQGDKSKISSSLDLAGVVFQEAGKYTAKLFVNDQEIAQKTFDIILREEQK